MKNQEQKLLEKRYDQQHQRLMTRLRYALIIAILALILSFVLAIMERTLGSAVLGSGSMIGLVSIFIGTNKKKTPVGKN